MKLKYLLSDLDGVVRIYPPEHARSIETKYNLPPGIIFKIAFDKTLLQPAVCGEVSDETWRTNITRSLATALSCEKVAKAAIVEWSSFSGIVDECYLDLLTERFPALPVALLTNGTTRLNRDLDELGLQGRFAKIFSSAELGVCKPDAKIYQHVLKELACEPAEILFIDDSLAHVQAADALGIRTHHYTSRAAFAASFPPSNLNKEGY